ncbi:GMP/IMP nucleotidase YrfG [Candidatus Methanoperedenaceae archaeon GB50]|nr:GMP/IMP nucleotidase YrfG [Candidatus Methanoperedenaceae archaeon GB50]
MKGNHKIFWDDIEWVLLDLDGTLLDKYFDDYFWETLVPEKYAQKYGLSFQEAKEKVVALYQREEGTLNWTDLDFWSKKLALDPSCLKKTNSPFDRYSSLCSGFFKISKTNG